MLVLRLLSPDARSVLREFHVAGAEITIGRDRDNMVVLSDDSVSRHHARLRITADAYTILDENSANGVWVRGARIRSAPLSPDDLFHVGDCLLQLVVDDARPAAPVSPPASPPRAKSWGCAAAVLALLVAGAGCGGGLMLYLLRERWMPLVSGGGSSTSTDGTPAGMATPPVQETPCPPAAARLCPWTYGTPPAAECPPGFCWDGGPLGSASCKQLALAEHAHRSQWSDVFCDAGFTPVLSRCSDVIERCVAGR
jgi:hypothetical protein